MSRKPKKRKNLNYVHKIYACEFTKINFDCFKNLHSLELEKSKIHKGKNMECFNGIANLKELKIINPVFIKPNISLNGIIGKDIRVLELDFSNCKRIANLTSDEFKTFKNLRKLSLRRCNIDSLKFLSCFQKLETLRLHFVKPIIKISNDFVKSTPHLKKLELQRTDAFEDAFEIKETFRDWKELQEVDILSCFDDFYESDLKFFNENVKVNIVKIRAKKGKRRKSILE